MLLLSPSKAKLVSVISNLFHFTALELFKFNLISCYHRIRAIKMNIKFIHQQEQQFD